MTILNLPCKNTRVQLELEVVVVIKQPILLIVTLREKFKDHRIAGGNVDHCCLWGLIFEL